MRSNLHVRICVLPVVFRAAAVLYRELGTVMQTPETHRALIFDPHGTSVLHFDGLHGAFYRAQSAADTVIFHAEMRRFSCPVVIYRL